MADHVVIMDPLSQDPKESFKAEVNKQLGELSPALHINFSNGDKIPLPPLSEDDRAVGIFIGGDALPDPLPYTMRDAIERLRAEKTSSSHWLRT